jgi:aminopeptidase-like protein/aminoglycoside N3'-acetyltransferase
MTTVTMTSWDYRRADLVDALADVGIQHGDIVYFHICVDSLGKLENASEQEVCKTLLEVLQGAVGEEGTILIPTYTFSFCKGQDFDVDNTPTEGGPWSTFAPFLEYFRNQPGVIRSCDPIHSVAGLGPRAQELLRDLPNTCFGKDSVHDRLLRMNGKICLLGVGLQEATFQHHVEEMVGVPFRFQKLFTGTVREKGIARKAPWLFNVHLLAPNGEPEGARLNRLARTAGKCSRSLLGRGEVVAITAHDLHEVLSRALKRDPWFTATGPAADPVAVEDSRVAGAKHSVELRPGASMQELIDSLWTLPRHIISDGYDAALSALSTQLPMTIHEYPTGTECWSWFIPEKWTCHEAYLETLNGERLFSYEDHPLHVVSYSLPFEGEVSLEELQKHLHAHPLLPDATPFIFKYYERDWGLCCSKTLKDSLKESHYRVVIRTAFSYGTLKVGEVVVPGESDQSFVLCAHLCHPGMVNDDLSGVVVGMKVMEELLKRKKPRYTYRFIILPETIGSIAYLSHHEHLIPQMRGGLFLEMLGMDSPHALQLSFHGDTELDRFCTEILQANDPAAWTGKFRMVIGNDERQFNAPGVRVPMLSLSRVLRPDAPDWPYIQYHSDADTPAITSVARLEKSRDLVLKMIEEFDRRVVPTNKYKGEIFCSRFGIHIDPYENPEGHRALFDILDQIDGTRSTEEIARICGISEDSVRRTTDALLRFNVIEYL